MTKSDLDSRYVAKTLSSDLLPWERQPDEGEQAYQAFKAWLDSDKRKVSDHGASAKNWSAQWSWSLRAHEHDVYMSRVDLEDQIRHRRKMNARHRQIAQVAQGKIVTWLNQLDEGKISKMSTADATRLLDVAVRIERLATAMVNPEDLPMDPAADVVHEGSLEQRLAEAGLDQELSEVARLIHEKLKPSASDSETVSESGGTHRAPQAGDAAPPGPHPDEETPQASIWGPG